MEQKLESRVLMLAVFYIAEEDLYSGSFYHSLDTSSMTLSKVRGFTKQAVQRNVRMERDTFFRRRRASSLLALGSIAVCLNQAILTIALAVNNEHRFQMSCHRPARPRGMGLQLTSAC